MVLVALRFAEAEGVTMMDRHLHETRLIGSSAVARKACSSGIVHRPGSKLSGSESSLQPSPSCGDPCSL